MIGGMNFAKLMEQKIFGQKIKQIKQIKQKKKSENLMNVKSQESESLLNFYADDQIKRMREMLSQYWSERLDGEVITAILLAGNEGYDNLDERTLVQEFESVFGENYFSGD